MNASLPTGIDAAHIFRRRSYSGAMKSAASRKEPSVFFRESGRLTQRALHPPRLDNPLHAHRPHIAFEFGELDRRQGGMRGQADMRQAVTREKLHDRLDRARGIGLDAGDIAPIGTEVPRPLAQAVEDMGGFL